jgi:hypothetical protein
MDNMPAPEDFTSPHPVRDKPGSTPRIIIDSIKDLRLQD